MNFRIVKRVSHVCELARINDKLLLFRSVLHRGYIAEYSTWKRRGIM